MIRWEIPIKTVSESNSSEPWRVKSQRHRQQQFFVRSIFNAEAQEIPLPCIVTLTRVSPRFLDDDDNLPIAFKWIKDEIGACILPDKVYYYKRAGKLIANKGHADSDSRIKWKYAQEKGKKMGIRIEIRGLTDQERLGTVYE